jgi:hypothetical protein
MAGMRPQLATLVGLLVLVPVVGYWLGIDKVGNVPALSVVCVLLVVGSLWTMFSPTTSGGVGH